MSEQRRSAKAAFLAVLDTLREASEGYLGRGLELELDRLEGLRYLLHLASAGIDFYLEGDPERPRFVRMVSPTRKLGGDNPDAIYHFAPVRGDRSYRITGRRGRECYLSFTIHGRTDSEKLGMTVEPVLADVNDRGMHIEADGRFEVILSPDPQPGNWLQLPGSAASVIVRHFFELPQSAADDPEILVELRIEPLSPLPPRPPLTDEVLTRRLADLEAFIRGSSIELLPLTSLPVPFVSRTPNELPQPFIFRHAGQAAWGAVDIAYAMAPFKVGPEEALVMEGTLPACAFANVMLWNRHLQTLEYRDRRISLNRRQMTFAPDGSFRIVIAHRDPGLPNWLDPEGHTEGTIFWRILLPEAEPTQTRCRLLPLSELPR